MTIFSLHYISSWILDSGFCESRQALYLWTIPWCYTVWKKENHPAHDNEHSYFLQASSLLPDRCQSLLPPHCFNVSVTMRLRLRTETQIHKGHTETPACVSLSSQCLFCLLSSPTPCLTYLHDWTSSSLEEIPLKQLLPPHTSAGGLWNCWAAELGVTWYVSQPCLLPWTRGCLSYSTGDMPALLTQIALF